jgi:hypothetical protein
MQFKRVKDTLSKDWFTKEIKEAIYERDNCNQSHPDYNKIRNKVTSLKRTAKKQHLRNMVNENATSKSMWKAIDCATNNKVAKRPTPITALNPTQLNIHFNTVPKKTVLTDNTAQNDLTALKNFCRKKEIHHTVDIPLLIPLLTVSEVYEYLRKLKPSNTRGLDNIDSKILKLSAPFIADSLTFIYNQCISKKYFPNDLKKSKIIPIFKKGDKTDPSNYRPISILPVLSKPLEKHLEKHLNNHVDKFKLLHKNQSGFRKHHSCHTALTDLVEQFHTNIKDKKTNRSDLCRFC